jgi:hypothetical protein
MCHGTAEVYFRLDLAIPGDTAQLDNVLVNGFERLRVRTANATVGKSVRK